jgi:glycosyltransferase involved in cell wall biosynthesis
LVRFLLERAAGGPDDPASAAASSSLGFVEKPETVVQFHLLSFEGPDPYARAGGLASRVEGLASSLASQGFEVHLWFVGDPDAPGRETVDGVELHRWCQWISRHHPLGVYQGEEAKLADYGASLPPRLVEHLEPHLRAGGHAVVLAEEWQTAAAVTHLHERLRAASLRGQVSLLWNANNGFGFERIDWPRLAAAATVTTVSRYMKHAMRPLGVSPIVIPNGLGPDAYGASDWEAVAAFRRRTRGRTVLVKIARFDPSKRWLQAVHIAAEMKRLGWRPLLVSRGGAEGHGAEVRRASREAGLVLSTRRLAQPGAAGVLAAVEDVDGVDGIELDSYVDPLARRLLLESAAVVLANSEHEPFGLVGLEAMAVGGLACTGSSGEEYAIPGHNALVLEADGEDAREFVGLYRPLRLAPERERPLREAGRATAHAYAWPRVLRHVLLPRIELARDGAAGTLV